MMIFRIEYAWICMNHNISSINISKKFVCLMAAKYSMIHPPKDELQRCPGVILNLLFGGGGSFPKRKQLKHGVQGSFMENLPLKAPSRIQRKFHLNLGHKLRNALGGHRLTFERFPIFSPSETTKATKRKMRINRTVFTMRVKRTIRKACAGYRVFVTSARMDAASSKN